MNSKISYLAYNKFHTIKIDGLSPSNIKSEVKRIKRDHEDIRHTTALNYVSKSLGIKGGFASYKKEYGEKLLPFMDKHGLAKHKDLVTIRKPGFEGKGYSLSRQRISERLFLSDYDLPEQIFTGYDFNYQDTIDDLFYNHQAWLEVISKRAGSSFIYDSIEQNIFDIEKIKDELVTLGDETRRIQDVLLGIYSMELRIGVNLIGDQLIKPRIRENTIQMYFKDEASNSSKREVKNCRALMDFFRDRIDSQSYGWVAVIPYNESLVFLRGQNGEYDFVFKNQRELPFVHQVFDGKLKISDIPYFVEDYDFDRWQYFENKRWIDRDRDEAEKHYYKTGGKSRNYPGNNSILRAYYKINDLYLGRNFKCSGMAQSPESFVKVKLDGNDVAVSTPVSIDDFFEFIKEHSDYMQYRVGDNLLNVNSDTDYTLPASCTWFDAMAYCSWYCREYNLPVRLLTAKEYKELRCKAGPIVHQSFIQIDYPEKQKLPVFEYRNDLIFSGPQGDYDGHPPYLNDFDGLKLRFKPNLKFLSLNNNNFFVDSNDFAEWVVERTCVRSGNLKNFRGSDDIRMDAPLDSTGKYKHLKIGFRLCLDV